LGNGTIHFFFKKERMAKMRNTAKHTFAIHAEVPAKLPKPRKPAMRAITIKTMA
jgi:hypothetical protein